MDRAVANGPELTFSAPQANACFGSKSAGCQRFEGHRHRFKRSWN